MLVVRWASRLIVLPVHAARAMGGGGLTAAIIAVVAGSSAWTSGRSYESWAAVPAPEPVCRCQCVSPECRETGITTTSTSPPVTAAPRATLGELVWWAGGWAVAALEGAVALALGFVWLLGRCCPARTAPRAATAKKVAAAPTAAVSGKAARPSRPLAHLAVDAAEL